MSSVTHFEVYAEEPSKVAEFYRSLFGWQVDEAPGIDYWLIQTERPIVLFPGHEAGFNTSV